MRIAFIGVSHWHGPMYYRPAARLAGIQIVAVSDPDRIVAQRVAAELDAKAFVDMRELLAESRPDFVFAFGRHCDMAETGMALVNAGVPFLLEKPGGMNRGQVAAVRDAARAKGIYAGTGFNYRVSDLYKQILGTIGDDPVTHASFRFMAGGPNRYRETGCAWMLDPELSGGGPTINLSGHFIDLFRVFTRSAPRELTALMGNFTWGLPIEDYSSMIVRSDKSVCTIETAYTYPAPSGVFDLRFSLRTSRHYVVVRNDDTIEVHRSSDGAVERTATPVSNAYWYPVFVTETIDRFAKGLPPIASLDDLVDVMEVVDAAYASNRAGGGRIALGDGAEQRTRGGTFPTRSPHEGN